MSPVDEKAQPEIRKFGPFAVEDGKVRLIGVEVGDWGALLALVVSIGTLLWTVTDKLLLHPIPQIIAPRTIEFFCRNSTETDNGEACDPGEKLDVRASPISLVNRASAPHSYVLDSIVTDVSFLGDHGESKKDIELTWLYFSEATISGIKRSPAIPLMVEGGAAVAREIEFFPRLEIIADPKGGVPIANGENNLKFSDFETLIASGEIHEVKLTFKATALDTKASFSATCCIPVDDQFVKNAKGVFALFVRDCSRDRKKSES